LKTPQDIRDFQGKDETRFITQIDSRAFQAGFRPGGMVHTVNRRRVQTLAEIQPALQGAQSGFAISLLRGDFNLTVIAR
jgi:hypothetical protein